MCWHYSTGNHPDSKKRGALSHISGTFHQGHHVLQPLGCFALLFKNLQRIDNSLFQLTSLNNVSSLDSAR